VPARPPIAPPAVATFELAQLFVHNTIFPKIIKEIEGGDLSGTSLTGGPDLPFPEETVIVFKDITLPQSRISKPDAERYSGLVEYKIWLFSICN